MTHLEFFGLEIVPITVGGRNLERHALDDLETETAQRGVLLRVVGHQPQPSCAEINQDLGTGAVVARVRLETEVKVCLHRILSLILQLIRTQLVEKPDAAPLLEEIEQDTFPLVGDLLHGCVELRSTVATPGSRKHRR